MNCPRCRLETLSRVLAAAVCHQVQYGMHQEWLGFVLLQCFPASSADAVFEV